MTDRFTRPVIECTRTTKNTIEGGKVYIKWNGKNLEDILEKVKSCIKSIELTRGYNWVERD